MIIDGNAPQAIIENKLNALLQMGGEVGRIAEELRQALNEIAANLSCKTDGAVRARHIVDRISGALQEERYDLAIRLTDEAAQELSVLFRQFI